MGLSQFPNSFPPSTYGFSSPCSPQFIRNDSFVSQAVTSSNPPSQVPVKSNRWSSSKTRTLIICYEECADTLKREKSQMKEAHLGEYLPEISRPLPGVRRISPHTTETYSENNNKSRITTKPLKEVEKSLSFLRNGFVSCL